MTFSEQQPVSAPEQKLASDTTVIEGGAPPNSLKIAVPQSCPLEVRQTFAEGVFQAGLGKIGESLLEAGQVVSQGGLTFSKVRQPKTQRLVSVGYGDPNEPHPKVQDHRIRFTPTDEVREQCTELYGNVARTSSEIRRLESILKGKQEREKALKSGSPSSVRHRRQSDTRHIKQQIHALHNEINGTIAQISSLVIPFLDFVKLPQIHEFDSKAKVEETRSQSGLSHKRLAVAGTTSAIVMMVGAQSTPAAAEITSWIVEASKQDATTHKDHNKFTSPDKFVTGSTSDYVLFIPYVSTGVRGIHEQKTATPRPTDVVSPTATFVVPTVETPPTNTPQITPTDVFSPTATIVTPTVEAPPSATPSPTATEKPRPIENGTIKEGTALFVCAGGNCEYRSIPNQSSLGYLGSLRETEFSQFTKDVFLSPDGEIVFINPDQVTYLSGPRQEYTAPLPQVKLQVISADQKYDIPAYSGKHEENVLLSSEIHSGRSFTVDADFTLGSDDVEISALPSPHYNEITVYNVSSEWIGNQSHFGSPIAGLRTDGEIVWLTIYDKDGRLMTPIEIGTTHNGQLLDYSITVTNNGKNVTATKTINGIKNELASAIRNGPLEHNLIHLVTTNQNAPMSIQNLNILTEPFGELDPQSRLAIEGLRKAAGDKIKIGLSLTNINAILTSPDGQRLLQRDSVFVDFDPNDSYANYTFPSGQDLQIEKTLKRLNIEFYAHFDFDGIDDIDYVSDFLDAKKDQGRPIVIKNAVDSNGAAIDLEKLKNLSEKITASGNIAYLRASDQNYIIYQATRSNLIRISNEIPDIRGLQVTVKEESGQVSNLSSFKTALTKLMEHYNLEIVGVLGDRYAHRGDQAGVEFVTDLLTTAIEKEIPLVSFEVDGVNKYPGFGGVSPLNVDQTDRTQWPNGQYYRAIMDILMF